MPLYEFIVECEGNEVARLNLPLSVESRDAVTITRSPLPRSISIAGTPPTQSDLVLRGYAKEENRIGDSKVFRQLIGHTPETVKRAWAHPNP